VTSALLEVEDLSIEFATEAGPLRAVEQVSFRLEAGRTLGLVGESGCGKSVTSLALMGLLPGNGRIVTGRILFEGTDLATLDQAALRRLRGRRLSMIFQEPMTALNPVYRAGDQIVEVLRRHEGLSRRAALDRAIEMLARVGIAAPEQRMVDFPHQMSGGMRQRIMIAMALVCRPRLLIADEPTTALDVTTQAQVLAEISQLAAELDTAVLLITHDLGVVAETCDEVMVMYAGQVVEQAPVGALFAQPRHRYSEGLLASIPRIRKQPLERLPVIPGTVPELSAMPTGCRFAARCPQAQADCRARTPELRMLGRSRSACFHPAGEE